MLIGMKKNTKDLWHCSLRKPVHAGKCRQKLYTMMKKITIASQKYSIMPSQIFSLQSSRRFIKKRVNTPVMFHLLEVPNDGEVDKSFKLPQKLNRGPSKKKLEKNSASFVVKPPPTLQKDQVHISRSYASSMATFFKTCGKTKDGCQKYICEFKKAIYEVKLLESANLKDSQGGKLTMAQLANLKDDGNHGIIGVSDSTKDVALKICWEMSRQYGDDFFNKSIAKLCSLHFDNFHGNAMETHNITCERLCETTKLRKETQEILHQCYKIGIASGICDGKSAMDSIVGYGQGSRPGVYCFKTAQEKKLIKDSGGKTNYNRMLPFKVTDPKVYNTSITEKVNIVQEFWVLLGTQIEQVVLRRIAEVLPLEEEDFDETGTQSSTNSSVLCESLTMEETPTQTAGDVVSDAETKTQVAHGRVLDDAQEPMTELTQWDGSQFQSDLHEMDTVLQARIREAMLCTLELGYMVGYRDGQKQYKDYSELTHDPWIYSFVDPLSKDGVYMSTRKGYGNKRAPAVGISPKHKRARYM